MTAKDCRECNRCKQELPLSEFYDRQTRCKKCMYIVNKSRRHETLPKAKLSTAFGSEASVIEELRKRGIPAYPGKAVSYALVDVVAWGCVGIEVKSSQLSSDGYHWGFTRKQLDQLQSDVIILVTNEPEIEFYLFPANHPVFFYNGQRKKGVCYLPIPHNPKHPYRNPMTDADMEQAHDRWELVELAKQDFCEQLTQGAAFPKWLR